MTKAFLTILGISLLLVTTAASQDSPQQDQPSLPPGMKASMATIEGIVERVFAVDDNGARFRAYQVRWKDYDVIVSDPLATTDYHEGDQITFMAQRMEMKDMKIKTLNFMVFGFNATRQ